MRSTMEGWRPRGAAVGRLGVVVVDVEVTGRGEKETSEMWRWVCGRALAGGGVDGAGGFAERERVPREEAAVWWTIGLERVVAKRGGANCWRVDEGARTGFAGGSGAWIVEEGEVPGSAVVAVTKEREESEDEAGWKVLASSCSSEGWVAMGVVGEEGSSAISSSSSSTRWMASALWSSAISRSSTTSCFVPRPLVMHQTPRKVSAMPPKNSPSLSAVVFSKSRYNIALPVTTNMVKQTNCVGMTCVESKRCSALLTYLICMTAVKTNTATRRYAIGNVKM